MTHISKKKLGDDEFERLFNQLQEAIGQLTKKSSRGFLDDLLTESEKIMLTKRFCAIILFNEHCSTHRVAVSLKLSPSTAERYKLGFEVGQYDHILHAIKKEKKWYMEALTILETMLQAGMPPMGRGRWSILKNR